MVGLKPELSSVASGEDWSGVVAQAMAADCVVDPALLTQLTEEREEWRQRVYQRRIKVLEPVYAEISTFMGEEMQAGRQYWREPNYQEWVAELTKDSIDETLRTVEEERAYLVNAAARAGLAPHCRPMLVAGGEECIRDGLSDLFSCWIPAPKADLPKALAAMGIASSGIDDTDWRAYREARMDQMIEALRGYREETRGFVECARADQAANGLLPAERSPAQRELIESHFAKHRLAGQRLARAKRVLWQSEWDWFDRVRQTLNEPQRIQASQAMGATFMPTLYPCPFLDCETAEAALSSESGAALSAYRTAMAGFLREAEEHVARFTTRSFGSSSSNSRRLGDSYLRSMREIRTRAREALVTLIAAVPEADRSSLLTRIPALEMASGEWPDLRFVDNPEWPSLYPNQREEWFVRGE